MQWRQGGGGQAMEDAELSVDLLQRTYPQILSTWISVGIYAAIVGYGVSTLGICLEYSAAELFKRVDPWVLGCSLVALTLQRTGRARAAGLLVLGPVWVEQHITLATMPQQVWAAPASVLPLLVLLTGLFLGARPARWLGATTIVSVPATVLLSGALELGPGLRGIETVPLLVGVTVTIGVTLLLLSYVLQMLGKLLRASEEDKVRLRQLVDAERQARLLQAQLQQAQKMEAVGILAGSVAHDFNNLLTAVGGYGSLLQRSTDATARAYAMELTSVQERGASLVKQLLTFARRDAVQPRPIDLAELLSALAPLMQRVVGEQVQLSLELGETCPVVVDPGQLEQVMLNLVANARDSMPDGGKVAVRCWRAGARVMLEVRDTGEGMSQAVQARAFDPFFTTKEAGKGTGLGLSTAASIVRDAGGTIGVQSEVGAGACFTIALPATDLLPQAIARRTARTSEPSGRGRHIVVAEDNDAVRSYLKLMLERAGFLVTMVRSGDEAAATLMAMSTPPDLLLTDVVMPGRTGPQVAADARVRFPDLPVLFMSGYAGEAGKRADFSPEDLVRKPFTDHELLDRIEEKLSRRAPVAAAG